MSKFSKSVFLLLFTHSSFIFAAPANLTWVGNTASMGTASNWSPAQVPNAGEPYDNLTFPSTMGPSRSVINDIAGSLLIGDISIADAYSISGANSFTIQADKGFLLTFTSTGANIEMSTTTPGMILDGTWQVTSTAGGNAIDTVIQGTSSGNLYLTNGLLQLGGNNQYGGVLTIGNEIPLGMNPTATLQATAANAFGNSAFQTVVTVSSTAILDLNSNDNAVGSLGSTAGAQVLLGTATLTVNHGSAQVPFYGVISGTGNLVVETDGLALLGTNTYLGSTTIKEGGHLALLTLGSTSQVNIGAGGGSLVFGQSGTYSIPISLQGEGTLGLGEYSVTLSGTISATGAEDFAKTGPGTLTLTGTNTAGGNIHVWGGILKVNSASLGNYTGLTWDPPTPTVGRAANQWQHWHDQSTRLHSAAGLALSIRMATT